MYYVELKNGEKLAYQKIGSGLKTIIMIHGNICSGQYFVDYAKYIQQGYTVFIPDMRGFGDSSYKNKIESIADFTSDLDDFVSCLKLNSFALLGWSAGGCICMDYAAKHPSKVWALVLIESVGIRGCPMFDHNGKAFNSIESICEEPTQVNPTLQAIKKHDIDFIKKLWDSAIYIHNKPNSKQATWLAYASLKQRNLSEVYWALSCFNLSHESNGYCDGNGLYSEIKTPTLLTFGEHDKIISREDIEMTSNLINAELLILKNCGHSPFMDCPEFLTTKLMYWLNLKFKSKRNDLNMLNKYKDEPIILSKSIMEYYIASPEDSFFVNGSPPVETVEVVAYDGSWPATYAKAAFSIESELGSIVQKIDHVGSTAVPGIAAKPWIDIDLTVVDPANEKSYLDALEKLGYELIVREPRFYGHHLFHLANPRINLHVFAPNSPETIRHLLFRDWLRQSPEDCKLYADAKLQAFKGCEVDIAKYHENKQMVVHEIYTKIFQSLALIDNDDVQK